MKYDALVVQHLRVDRFYGFGHTGLAASDLVRGINVIYGPNGQGKTTLSRAIHGLVWPASIQHYSPILHGLIRVGEDEWDVEIEAGMRRFRRQGSEIAPPTLPDSDFLSRYVLSLHELLHADGEDFAALIQRMAAGGFDVLGAAESLGFASFPPRPGTATRAAEAAYQRVEAVAKEQGELERDRARLGHLRTRLEAADEARRHARLYELISEYAEAREAYGEAHARLGAMHTVPEAARPDDSESLKSLMERAREAERRLEVATRAAEEAQTQMAETVVARAKDAAVPLHALDTLLHDIVSTEGDLARAREAVAVHAVAEEQRWMSIEHGVDRARAEGVGVQEMAKLGSYAKKAARIIAQRDVHEARNRAVEACRPPEAQAQEPALEALDEGIRTLRAWLHASFQNIQEAPQPVLAQVQRARVIAFVSAALTAVGGIGLGLAWHPAGFALAAAALLLAVVALLLRRPDSSTSDRAQARADALIADYKRLTLGSSLQPTSWTGEHVEDTLRVLEGAAARTRSQVELDRSVTARLEALLADGEVLNKQLRDLSEEAKQLGTVLGVLADPTRSQHDAPFVHLALSLHDWLTARISRLAAERQCEVIEARLSAHFEEAHAWLSPYGFDRATTKAVLAEQIEALRVAVDAFEEAKRDHERAGRDMEEARQRGREADAEIAALYARLGLAPTDGPEAVERICKAIAPYRQAEEAMKAAAAVMRTAQTRLEQHPEFDAAYLEMRPEDALTRSEEAERVRATRDEIADEIARLEQRLESAEQGAKLRTARADHEAALAVLYDEREQAVASRIGHLIASRVADVQRREQMPAVLQRAQSLFADITHHRYRLEIDPANAQFVAVDTERNRTFRLDELSSGTRLQLLLSVRIAFAEQMEQGVRLPIVLDEVLANSDGPRAEAIVDAVLALCREGRQVFYFTSQADEVAKWKQLTSDHDDVASCFVALGNGAAIEAEAMLEARPMVPEVLDLPQPETWSHAEYGELLRVPPWNGWQPVDALHLWYVIDDPQELYQTLQSGFRAVGPLLSALERPGRTPLPLRDETCVAIVQRVNVLRIWQEAWRIGRGQLVDRDVLEKSNEVSERFIDEVAAYSRSVGGDAEALIAGLRANAVASFRDRKTDALEVYLREHGYLDRARPYEEEELWGQVVSRLPPDVALGDVQAFLERVRAGAPARG